MGDPPRKPWGTRLLPPRLSRQHGKLNEQHRRCTSRSIKADPGGREAGARIELKLNRWANAC